MIRGSRHPQIWPAGGPARFSQAMTWNLGVARPQKILKIFQMAGRRAKPVEAQFSTNDRIPKVSFNKITICIHVIILIGLRGDTHKSSWDVATKPFSR